MIKLNNKNITYVALADTNNSIKAPKEIWYADSNNSVKLVYRRKDALIEGEDYEKYHWLRAEMPLNKLLMALSINSNNVDYYIKRLSLGNITILITNGYKYFFWRGAYQIGSYGNGADIEHYPYSSDTQLFHIVTNSTNVLINDIQFNSVGFPIQSINFITGPAGNEGVTLTSTISVDGIERYIPCKLLKPVPKWLDANGIRRQVGECGMIDLISGEFYGNVNSVGTFTVENYYERKEWLVGDGGANIDGTLICTDYLEWKLAQYSGQYVALNYGKLSDNSHQFQLSVNSNATNKIGVFFNDTRNYVSLSQQSVNDIKFLVNSQIIGIINNVNIENNNSNLKFNGEISLNLIAKSGGISKITVDNKERYIPCTLTMDLPASMDTNNIARTKGTSGMWDLVSDRFYGNVANSGTFKAVNLAEGVDYEVHDWLVGDGAYFRTHVNIYQESLYVKFHPTSSESNHEFWAGFYNISSDAIIEVRGMIGGSNGLGVRFGIRENGLTTASVIYKTGLDYLSDFSIETQYSEDNKVNYTFNGTSGTATPIIDSRANVNVSVKFITTWCRFAKVTTDRINLIPVKLLRPIPSKYDANGIARQAGECGMYDTVNDVFYGNVASSGTFSVSDD